MSALTTRAPSQDQIISLLSRPDIKEQMALALPKHVTAERLARIAMTEVRKNPKLMSCDQVSFMGAIMQCCQLGLEPGGALGHAYLIPFENRSKGIVECQFLVGYRGMIDLARRSGQIISLSARVVRLGDQFSYSYGLDETIEHVPGAETGPMTHVYAVAKLKDGGQQFEVMTRADVEEIRDNSQGYKSAKKYNRSDTPWITSFDEMARKTVTRRLFKWLPVSIELATAVALDEQADGGSQDSPLAHLSAAPVAAAALPESVTVTKALLSEQQLQTIGTAMERRLNPVGVATFTAQMDQPLESVPADQFSAVMAGLASTEAVDRWNAGFHSETGDQLLEPAVIESIVAASVQPAEGPEPAVARRRVGAA